MAIENSLIMNLLRLITPEEVSEIATKHNGGKFILLTDLVNERVEKNINRDFSNVNAMHALLDEVDKRNKAKILPFKRPEEGDSKIGLSEILTVAEVKEKKIEHKSNENMSSFILIEKERLKKSQNELKKKEIIDLYYKNSNIVLEEIKNSNADQSQSREMGVLVNKRHF